MNNERRKEVVRIQKEMRAAAETMATGLPAVREIIEKALQEAQAVCDTAIGSINFEDFATDLETVRDEEQEYYDNMPEGFQNGERGEMANMNIEQLESAHEKAEELRDLFTELDLCDLSRLEENLDGLDEAVDKMNEAADGLDDAVN
jgi:hypothetical protein